MDNLKDNEGKDMKKKQLLLELEQQNEITRQLEVLKFLNIHLIRMEKELKSIKEVLQDLDKRRI